MLIYIDFRLKCMTFDNVPWICTMKKNDHYFPTMEWVKDPSEECGWRRVTYENGQVIEGEGHEGTGSVGAEDEDGGDGGDSVMKV
jgi:hypothetical protein